MAAIASTARAAVFPLSHTRRNLPSCQHKSNSFVAPRVSLSRSRRSYGLAQGLSRLSSTIVPSSPFAELRKSAGSFTSSTTPSQTSESEGPSLLRRFDSVTSSPLPLAVSTFASVTALSALVVPSAVAAVTGADVSSVAADVSSIAGTAGDGALALSQLLVLGALSLADEPSNALSLPTWVIHVASVVEWVVAMILVWQYGAAESRRAWRGLAWGMVPLLMGAMCACTWHLFYNAPELEVLVVLQSLMTLLGNCTVCFAAYRIYQASAKTSP